MIVVVCGDSGTGKTKLIHSIVNALEVGGHWQGVIDNTDGLEVFYTIDYAKTMAHHNVMVTAASMNNFYFQTSREFATYYEGKRIHVIEDYRYDLPEEVKSLCDVIIHTGSFNYETRFLTIIKNKRGSSGQVSRFTFNDKGEIVWDENNAT